MPHVCADKYTNFRYILSSTFYLVMNGFALYLVQDRRTDRHSKTRKNRIFSALYIQPVKATEES